MGLHNRSSPCLAPQWTMWGARVQVAVHLLEPGLGLGLAGGPGTVLEVCPRGAAVIGVREGSECGSGRVDCPAPGGEGISSASLNTEPGAQLAVLCGHVPAGCLEEGLLAGP